MQHNRVGNVLSTLLNALKFSTHVSPRVEDFSLLEKTDKNTNSFKKIIDSTFTRIRIDFLC